MIDRAAIQHGQRARQADAHGTDVGVRIGAECGAAAAEDFRFGEELRVNLEPDDRLVSERHAGRSYTRGPAARTSGVTPPSNVLKFSANMRASFAAWAS